MMKLFPSLLIMFICCCLIGCNGCDDEMVELVPMGEECTPASRLCRGVAWCENGYCKCGDENRQIIPGFCIQHNDGATFVTYDHYPGIIDTLLLYFKEDPFNLTWAIGDPEIKGATGATYNRDPFIKGINIQDQQIGFFIWPGNFETPVDSIVVYPVFDKGGSNVYHNGEWLCRGKVFLGRFVNRNRIEGEIIINVCSTQGNTPRPPELSPEARYPVTFTRW